MTKNLIKLTERQLYGIVKSATHNVLNEMAVSRSNYFQYCLNQSATVLVHIGKICVYEDDIKMSHWVNHWEEEIGTQIYDLARIDITKDNNACKIKKKAFIQSFIEGRLGKDFDEYDDKFYLYIIDALYDEQMTKEQIRQIDVKKIAADNKERIKKYLYSFVDVLSINDLDEMRKKCYMLAKQF